MAEETRAQARAVIENDFDPLVETEAAVAVRHTEKARLEVENLIAEQP
jgi:hypothetical protein